MSVDMGGIHWPLRNPPPQVRDVDDATFRAAPSFTSAQVHAPILRDGSSRYPQGSAEPILFPLTDGLPHAAEVEDGGAWRPAQVTRADEMPSDLVALLTRQAGRAVSGAVLFQGSADWPASVRRFRVRLHDGDSRPVRNHALVVG